MTEMLWHSQDEDKLRIEFEANLFRVHAFVCIEKVNLWMQTYQIKWQYFLLDNFPLNFTDRILLWTKSFVKTKQQLQDLLSKSFFFYIQMDYWCLFRSTKAFALQESLQVSKFSFYCFVTVLFSFNKRRYFPVHSSSFFVFSSLDWLQSFLWTFSQFLSRYQAFV